MTAEKKKILIIDDDPDFVDGIRSILETAEPPYEVDAAYNPKDGFELLQGKRYDLLLLDIMMGRGAEGVMLARKMGDDPVLREVPVLIITGIREQIAYLFPGQAVHPHFVAVDELVEKPVEPGLLLDKAQSLIEAAEARKKQQKK
jgi:CheY-like chemotaxis protein